MLGWLADLFRLPWAFVYWNIRKSWFQHRRGRSPCPCQSPSDSGRGMETHCEASLHWAKPIRFRRVCPLLVQTADGPRCSVNAPEVRPFWGVATAYFAGTALAMYLAGVLAVFIVLRTIGYPISIVHVTWPGLWHRVPQARGWFFYEKSRKAFDAGHLAEGLLSLQNAYDFDPGNYQIGLALAKNYQISQPAKSDEVFQRLMRDHPENVASTAQEWFRAALPRGDYPRIVRLAAEQIIADPATANVWMRALFFATRQLGDDEPLRQLYARTEPAGAIWRRLIEMEIFLRVGRTAEARASLLQPWPANAPAFTIVHRVGALITLGDPRTGLDLLESNRALLNDEIAYRTLKLDTLAAIGLPRTYQLAVQELLAQRLDPATLTLLCAHLIRHPNAELFSRLHAKVEREGMPFDATTLGLWLSLMGAAGASGDTERLHALTEKLKQAAQAPLLSLQVFETFLRGQTADRRITSVLPMLPLPLEVTYALFERYPERKAPTSLLNPPGTRR